MNVQAVELLALAGEWDEVDRHARQGIDIMRARQSTSKSVDHEHGTRLRDAMDAQADREKLEAIRRRYYDQLNGPTVAIGDRHKFGRT